MSTKMYNLYRTTMNLLQLDAWLQALKERHMESLVHRIAPFAKYLGVDIWKQIDEYTMSGLRSPFNIDASVVVYVDGSKLYVQFFGVDNDLYEKEVQEGLLVDFHYQDSADKPDNVSKQEWSKRSKVVDRILSKDDSGVASRCGFCRALTDEMDCMKVATYVRRYLERAEGRQHGQKGRLLLDYTVEHTAENDDDADGEGFNPCVTGSPDGDEYFNHTMQRDD